MASVFPPPQSPLFPNTPPLFPNDPTAPAPKRHATTPTRGAVPGELAGFLPQGLDIQALRTMLVKRGYHIPTKGDSAGKLMLAALRDFVQPAEGHPLGSRIAKLLKGGAITGLRDPKGFNQRYGLQPGGTVHAPIKSPASRLTPAGTPTAADNANTAPVPVDANGNPAGADPPVVDLRGLRGLYAQGGKLGTDDPMIPTSYADKLAGLSHDAKIRDLGIAGLRQGRDSEQSLHDIAHWMGVVEQAQGVAGQRDHAISSAGVGSVKDAVNSIIGSLGGSANAGSADVGAAGADQVGLLGALGANEDQYNADLAPLLQAEGAGQMSQQRARNTAGAQDIQNQIVDEQGARGQDKAAALMQIMDANSQRRGQNNSLAQQRFQNNLAVTQAQEAAQLGGAKVLGGIQIAQIRANAKAAGSGGAPKGSWAGSSATDRSNFAKAINQYAAQPGMTRAKAMAFAQSLARTYFPNGGVPNTSGAIRGMLHAAGL